MVQTKLFADIVSS